MLARPRDTDSEKERKQKRQSSQKKKNSQRFLVSFCFLKFLFLFFESFASAQPPGKVESSNSTECATYQRWWKAKNSRQIEPATLYHSLCTIPSTHAHIWFHFASFIRSLVHFFPIHTFILSISVWIQCFCFLFSLMIENIDSKHLKMCAVCTMKLALVQTL